MYILYINLSYKFIMKTFQLISPSTNQNRLEPIAKTKQKIVWKKPPKKQVPQIGWWCFGHEMKGQSHKTVTHGHVLSCLIGLSAYRDTLHTDQLSCRGTGTETCLDWLACQHTGTRFVKYWLSFRHKGNISALTGCGVWIVGSAIQTVACWWPDVSQSTSLYPDGWQDCDDVTVHESDSGHVSTSLLCGLAPVLCEKHLQME